MNSILKDVIEQSYPKFNPNVVRGAGDVALEKLPEIFSNYIAKAMPVIENDIDLKYLGMRRIDAQEAFSQIVETQSNNFKFDISESYINLFQFMFSYKGSPVNIFLYLPFCDKGNIMKVSGNFYHVVPVLTDTVISPDKDSVFVRIVQKKLTFFSQPTELLIDNMVRQESMVYGKILHYDEKQVKKDKKKIVVPIGLYLLAKYGLKDTIRRYTTFEGDTFQVTTDLIDDATYEKYTLIQSTGKRLPGLMERRYDGHPFKILIRRDQKISSFTQNLVTGIIYILDVISGVDPYVANSLCNAINKDKLKDEINMWKIVLGKAALKFSYSEERTMREVNATMTAMDYYLDNISQEKLSNIGVKVENFYDLISFIMFNYSSWVVNHKEYSSNLDKRYLDIAYYILYESFFGFNLTLRNLKKRSQKGTMMQDKSVDKTFASEVKKKSIYHMVKPSEASLCFMKTDYPGDNMFCKGTKHLEDQNRGDGYKQSKRANFPTFMMKLKAEDMILGNLMFFSKKAPTPRLSFNPFLQYDLDSGRIILSDEQRDFIRRMSKILSPYNNIDHDATESMLADEERDVVVNSDVGQIIDDEDDEQLAAEEEESEELEALADEDEE